MLTGRSKKGFTLIELLLVIAINCTGYVTGALAGALSGCKGLPLDWVNKVSVGNKNVYGIGIEKNAHSFRNAVYGRE